MLGGAPIGTDTDNLDTIGKDGECYTAATTESTLNSTDEFGEQDTHLVDAPSYVYEAPTFNERPNIDSSINNVTFDEVYGGCYLDNDGNWVVWLTENTEEYQAAAFAQNSTLPEDKTIFRTANYSLTYLNAILTKISDVMQTGDLPFVQSAALMESQNCIVVAMTSDNAEETAQVLRFDRLGGAIEIVYIKENQLD